MSPDAPQARAIFFRTHLRTDLRAVGGFTLIEVLIALVVMTVGMLGVSFLCIEGLRLNRSAIYQMTAQNLAADIVERLRAGEFALNDPGRSQREIQVHLPADITAKFEFAPAETPSSSERSAMGRYAIHLQWPEPGRLEPASYRLIGHWNSE